MMYGIIRRRSVHVLHQIAVRPAPPEHAGTLARCLGRPDVHRPPTASRRGSVRRCASSWSVPVASEPRSRRSPHRRDFFEHMTRRRPRRRPGRAGDRRPRRSAGSPPPRSTRPIADVGRRARPRGRAPTSSSTPATRASTRRSSTARSRPAPPTSTWRCTSRTRTPSAPTSETGEKLGDAQFAVADAVGGGAAGSRSSGIGVEPGLSDVFARYAADHLFSTIDEVGVRDGANLVIDGYDFAPTFSIWTTIEECLNPPVIWERDRGWFTTAPFSEPETFDVPRRHRPGRVRERRARRGAARPALGRLQPRHVQVRARRRVHRGARGAAQDRPRPHRHGPRPRRRGVAARRRRRDAAEPGRARRPHARQDVRGHLGDRHRHRRQPARGVPAPRRRQRLVAWPSTATRPSCGRPRSTR